MRVAVYCGSSSGGDPRFMATAATIGTELARRGIGLVYGGGGDGCMGAVADAALGGGGEAIGVIPRALVDTESAHVGLTRLEIVASMHERKARMVALADGFLALPGGFGTLDELFETITWFALGIIASPSPCSTLPATIDRCACFATPREQWTSSGRRFAITSRSATSRAQRSPRSPLASSARR